MPKPSHVHLSDRTITAITTTTTTTYYYYLRCARYVGTLSIAPPCTSFTTYSPHARHIIGTYIVVATRDSETSGKYVSFSLYIYMCVYPLDPIPFSPPLLLTRYRYIYTCASFRRSGRPYNGPTLFRWSDDAKRLYRSRVRRPEKPHHAPIRTWADNTDSPSTAR